MPKKPGENMKAAEDFLDVVIEAHVIAAANSVPNKERITSAQEMAKKMVKSFVYLKVEESASDVDDGVYLYACDFLTLGLIWKGFYDAIREGDRERVMVYWMFFLPIFKLLGRKNYSTIAVDIQLLRHHHL